jgi:folate-binding protein YgfZ
MSGVDSVSGLRRSPVIVPAVVAFRGPDAARYLNGQTTQDVRLVKDGGRALPSCVTDAKGRLQFRVWIRRGGDGALFVSCEHAEPEALFARLSRYLIADDAEAEDESGRWRMLHVTGGVPGDFQEFAVAANRFGEPGWDVWIPEDVPDERLASLLAIAEWSAEEAETKRIAAGVPAWGAELVEGMLPPEAGLDRTDISYAKGCYIGQEVISRIKSAGKVNRKLVRLAVAPGVAVTAGARLTDTAGAEAGVVTSVSPVAGPEARALLGYLKRGAAAADLRLETGEMVRVSEIG